MRLFADFVGVLSMKALIAVNCRGEEKVAMPALGLRGVETGVRGVLLIDIFSLAPPPTLALERILASRSVMARGVGCSPLSFAGSDALAIPRAVNWLLQKLLTPCGCDQRGVDLDVMRFQDLQE